MRDHFTDPPSIHNTTPNRQTSTNPIISKRAHKTQTQMTPTGPNQYFMQSARVGFSWWQADDLPAAMSLWGDPQVTRLFTKDPLTQEQVTQRLTQELKNAQEHHIQYWAIFSLADDSLIGCAGLRPYAADTLELGFHLKPAYWGQGLATEVGKRVIEHAFENQLAKAIFAGHHPDNHASRNTLLKLGFIGTAAQYYQPTGLYHPSYLLYRDPPDCTPTSTTRLATPQDARALAIVHCYAIRDTFSSTIADYVKARSLAYCEEAWERRFANNECTTIALIRGEQIVGFASVAPLREKTPRQPVVGEGQKEQKEEEAEGDDDKSAGLLDRIYIHPAAWGNGFGNTLINWCEDTLKTQGYKTIKLWVFAVNERARRFYEKHGYKLDGHSKQDYGATLVSYCKSLCG